MAFKICMIGTQFIGVPTNIGGAIEYLSFNLAQGLAKKNFDITYFSVDPSVKSKQNFVIERFPAKKTNAFLFSLFVFFKSLPKKFDAVYVSGCSMIFAGLIISKFKKVPLIYHEFNHNPWIQSKSWFYDFLARFSVNKADYVIVASDFIRNAILLQTKTKESKIKKISNFVDLNEFPLKPAKKQKKILFVGRFVKHKGIDLLIEIIKKNSIQNWVFEFIGPVNGTEEEKAYLSKLIDLSNSMKEKVLVKKNVSKKQLINEFSSSSILVLPSFQESFGLVLTEAMACFAPCVAFSVGGTPEIIDNNINGFLVKLGDKKEFEKKLIELTKSENKRNLFGLNARKKVEEKFSFVNSLKEFELFLNKVLGEKK